ncbi:MAG: hypothetical protein IT331_13195 [Anaerolineae bacterium]|nr:hypothetical protein [Anaerolineae bacterium]
MKHRRQLIQLLAAFLLLVLLASTAFGAPEGACYLNPTPNAIQDALANPFCLQINLNPGVYQEYNLSTGRDIVLRGSGMDNTTIDGMQQDKIFSFWNNDATVMISDLTIRNGKAETPPQYGGAIHSVSKLFVRSVRFENNSAIYGGAIEGAGPLTSIQYSVFKGNSADTGGAIYVVDGKVTVDGSTFEENTAGRDGGAIYDANTIPLDVTNSTFKNNRATGVSPNEGYGGAILVGGPTNVMYSTFTGNRAAHYGGALAVAYGHPTYIWYSVFTDNRAGACGGAIDQAQTAGTLYIYFDTFKRNGAPLGGAIAAEDGQSLVVSYTTFVKNQAAPVTLDLNGSAPTVIPDAFKRVSPPIEHPTVPIEFHGGAVFAAVPTLVLNTTFSGNKATSAGGGFITNTSAAFSFVTFAGNKAGLTGGSIYAAGTNPYRVQLKNSLLSNGQPNNCGGKDAGSFNSSGGNLSSDHSCDTWFIQPGDQKGVNPLIGKLAKNGGPTKTRALLAGSPAIRAAVDCKDLFGVTATDDQRQYKRTAPCDIGAFETQ